MSPSRVRGVSLLPLLVVLGSGAARAQAPETPLACDFKRAPIGSWADYTIKVGNVGSAGNPTMKVRWAFLGRDATGNTVELTMEGTAAASARLGGKVVSRFLLLPDPVGSSKPFKQIIMQLENREPIELPLEFPGFPQQKFQNPDPKKMVGKETIVVGGRSIPASHYHDVLPDSVVDSWLSTDVPPLGVVKILSVPKPGAEGPGAKPLPTVTMELLAHGLGAKPVITRPAKPFDPEGGK